MVGMGVRLGIEGGTADYYADDSPERNRRQKKRAGLNTDRINSYGRRGRGSHKAIRYGNDDDADDDASSSRSPSRNVIHPHQDTGSGTIITTSRQLHQGLLFYSFVQIKMEDTCPTTACGA